MIQLSMLNLYNLPNLPIDDHTLMKQQMRNRCHQNLTQFQIRWMLKNSWKKSQKTYMWHSLLLILSKHINAFSSDGRKVLQDPAWKLKGKSGCATSWHPIILPILKNVKLMFGYHMCVFTWRLLELPPRYQNCPFKDTPQP